MSSTVPPLTLLYVPADRPDRMTKAFRSAADVVLVDLEDAVAPARKDEARANAVRLLTETSKTETSKTETSKTETSKTETSATVASRQVQVRVNHPSTPWHDDDIAALASLPIAVGARVPKVESPDEVRALAAALPGRALHPLIESALGVERALEIATASPQIASLALGEADLCSDLRVADEAGLTWARSRIIVAARAARLPPPAMSAYPNVQDLDGLAASCRAGRALGFHGRVAIHPGQLDTIRAAFLPTAHEIERARDVMARLDNAITAGVGAIALADGTFLDVAMIEQARAVLALADHTYP